MHHSSVIQTDNKMYLTYIISVRFKKFSTEHTVSRGSQTWMSNIAPKINRLRHVNIFISKQARRWPCAITSSFCLAASTQQPLPLCHTFTSRLALFTAELGDIRSDHNFCFGQLTNFSILISLLTFQSHESCFHQCIYMCILKYGIRKGWRKRLNLQKNYNTCWTVFCVFWKKS